MNVYLDKMLLTFRKLNMLDIGLFKTYLFSMGLVIGMSIKKASKPLKIVTGMVAAASGIYLIYRFFYKHWE